jgi:hypothetical protein
MAINNPLAGLGRYFTSPAPVDLSGFLQPTPYPVNPLVLLAGMVGAVKQARNLEAQRLAQQAAEEEDRKSRQQLLQAQLAAQQFNLQQAQEAAARRLQEQAREQARADLEFLLKRHGEAGIAANPALREHFLRLNALAGNPIPTERVRQMMGVQVGLQRPEEGGLGRFLAPRGQQTLEVPTGEEVEAPVVPQAPPEPPKRYLLYDQTTGQTRVIGVPAGTELRVTTSPRPEAPVPIFAVDAQGRKRQLGVAPPGSRIIRLPVDRATVDTSGLTPGEKRVVDNYNRLVDQRARLLGIAAQSLDEETRARARADIAELDRRLMQLRPQVDQILGLGQRPAAVPMTRNEQLRQQAARDAGVPAKTLTMAQIRAGAAAKGISIEQAIEDATKQGYTIVP